MAYKIPYNILKTTGKNISEDFCITKFTLFEDNEIFVFKASIPKSKLDNLIQHWNNIDGMAITEVDECEFCSCCGKFWLISGTFSDFVVVN